MRVAIFGSGGVGGYFGGRLVQSGEEVIFIARGEHLRVIRERGLRVDSPEGDFVVSPAQVSDAPAAVGTVEVILLGVKAWQVPEAAWAMRPMVGDSTFVVPLQNGVEAPMHLASVLGNGWRLSGQRRRRCPLSRRLGAAADDDGNSGRATRPARPVSVMGSCASSAADRPGDVDTATPPRRWRRWWCRGRGDC